jgi:DNA-binding transcriptional LysR family regulator
MELYQIRYFLAVADTLNFTRASERSFVSQPALTKAVQRLEETIGGRLLDRTKNAVQLTDLGRAMLPSLRQIYDSALQAREQARRLISARRDVVQVGVMCTIDFQHVLPGFAECVDSSGSLELRFRENNLEGLSDALDQGDIDVAVLCSPYEIPRRFRAAPLFHEDYVLAIGDDHRFNGRDSINMAELNREHYCYRVECEFSSYIDRLLKERGVALEVVQKSPREDWIQAFVRANFGVAFMPLTIAQAARLAYVRTADCPIVREISAVVQAERPLTAAQQAVFDALAHHTWCHAGGAVR